MRTDSSGLVELNKPQLTLSFKDIGFDIGEFCIPYLILNVSFTVTMPNWRGFVVDTQQLIARVRRLRVYNMGHASQQIIDVGKELMGSRLVSMNGTIRKESGDESHYISFGPATVDTSSYTKIVEKKYVPAKLIDDAVCGGFDGQFLCEVWVGEKELSGDSVINQIRFAFRNHVYKASCEELALGVCRIVRQVYPMCPQIMSRVYNQSGYAEVVWEQGMEEPAFPQRATPTEIKVSRSLDGVRPLSSKFC